MLKIILVLSAGAIGVGCRYGLSSLIYSRIKHPTFPYANLVTFEDFRVIQYRGPRAT